MKLPKGISNINASELRDVIVLKSVANVSDGEGGYTTNVTTLKPIYAKVDPRTESRILDAAQLEYTTSYKIYCRYDAEINNTRLLEYRGLDLTIHSAVNINGLNQFIDIIAYSNE